MKRLPFFPEPVSVERIHFVGIGGIGMSGIADILVQAGYSVSGSDLHPSPLLEKLAGRGVRIAMGHDQGNVGDAQVVVRSTAIRDDNPEVEEARRRLIPLVHRSEMLAALLRLKTGVAVSGTHGKTTTSAMIACILTQNGWDPTAIIGARVRQLGGNSRWGRGGVTVAEADESDRSLLNLPAVCAVVTNIDEDHMDCYADVEDLCETFLTFMNQVPFYGQVVLCADDPRLCLMRKKIHRRVLTYSVGGEADLAASEPRNSNRGTEFECSWRKKLLGTITLRVPGRHNVSNALAALTVGKWLGIPFPEMIDALQDFEGAERRLEWKGEAHQVWVMDDYAHHPTEIAATLEACQGWKRRLVVVYQPHRYSRTEYLMDRMGSCFERADDLFLLDVYGAGEAPLQGVDTPHLVDRIRRVRPVEYVSGNEVIARLNEHTRPGDLLLTMGAGDVWKVGEEFLAQADYEAEPRTSAE